MSGWIRRTCDASAREREGRLTYISLLVTGLPTKKLANRKLKMREVEPRGATYSESTRVNSWEDIL